MPKHECNRDVWDRGVTRGRNVAWDTGRQSVCWSVNCSPRTRWTGSAPERALCSWLWSPRWSRGWEHEGKHQWVYILKKKNQVQKNEKYGLWWQKIVPEDLWETLGVIQGKISFSFHCCWVFYFDLVLNLQLMQCVLRTHSPAISVPVVHLHLDCSVGGKARQCDNVLSNRMFFTHHKAPTRRWIIHEWLSLKFADFQSVSTLERWTQNLPMTIQQGWNWKGQRQVKIAYTPNTYRLTNCCLLHWVGIRHLHHAAEWPGVAGMQKKNWHQISFIEVCRCSCARQCQISAFERFLRRNTLKQHNY